MCGSSRPDLPPVLVSTRTSVITAPLSTALTMSTTVSAATETAVSASISTPVRSLVRTVALISTASSATARSTVTPEIASGWHSGISDGVCLAPMIPAIRATASASPFGTPSPRSSATTSADTSTRPDAVAVRAVTSLPDTSTIRAAPDSSTWVSRPDGSDIRTPRRASGPGPARRPATDVTSSGTTTSALDDARSPIRWEPCPPTGVHATAVVVRRLRAHELPATRRRADRVGEPGRHRRAGSTASAPSACAAPGARTAGRRCTTRPGCPAA